MALKDLTTPTMLTLFDAWLDAKRELPRLKALARASTLIPDLASAHKALQDSHAVSAKGSPDLQKVQARAAELDRAHDRKARGLDKVLDGLGELSDDADLTAGLALLRGELLGPKGLLALTASHGDEAQNAKLADARLTAGSKALLSDIALHGRSLGKWVKDWQRVAKELGEADAERTALEAKPAAGAQPSDAVRARNKAIRTINALLTLLDLDEVASDAAARAALLGPLDAALAKAGKRAKKGGGESGESGEGVTPTAPPVEGAGAKGGTTSA